MLHAYEYDIKQLNSLIAMTFDNAEEYEDAAAAVRDCGLSTMFRERAGERRYVAELLREAVRNLGGTAWKGGTVMAVASRCGFDLRTNIGGGDSSILADVEPAEDRLMEVYETVMGDRRLTGAVERVIAKAYRTIRLGNEQMRVLGDRPWERKAGQRGLAQLAV
jgi:uncharacterized protein (TIGR02284 family)